MTNLTWQWGECITVQDANGNQHIYAHLAERRVKQGETVKRGQLIGIEGGTGNAYGAVHLHYEIRTAGNVPIDPTPYLGILNAAGSHTVKNDEPAGDKPSEWAAADWKLAQELGITDGTRPKDNVTREEMAVMILRALVKANSKLK